MFSIIAALTSWNEDLRIGLAPNFWDIWVYWAQSAIALAALSWLLFAGFSRWPQVLSSGKKLIAGYLLLLLCLLPLQLLFVVQTLIQENAGLELTLNWNTMQSQFQVIDRFAYFLRFSSVTAVYVAVAAIKIWQQNQVRSRLSEQQRANLLSLKLELEEQKLLALRAQLEPHFVFNALNAISALVISDNKTNALNGIHGLSQLLRYALTASENNWVSMAQELAFIEEYLQLQSLRYGPRLQIQMNGITEQIREADCPPLLLQPLIENALRHDLDCHQDTSQIQVDFAHDDHNLTVKISNAIHANNNPNPGAGLGLRNTRARLQMAYGQQASLITQQEHDRYIVTLQLPLIRPTCATVSSTE
jgi:two-component system sensor histidine kinase AlgZ